MINDVLDKAIAEIEQYQQSLPKCYDGLRVEIGKVIAVMNSLRAWLDCPPSDGVHPRHEAAKERLMAELARLDVEPLLAAVANMRVSWPTEEEAEAAKKRKKGQAGETASSDDGSDNGVTNWGTH
jgi:energy-converting hydrogenase A subunit M